MSNWGMYYVGPPIDRPVSEHFNLREFRSRDGANQLVLSRVLVDMLQQLRDEVGKPIRINSGYRTPQHNARVGGAEASQHMYGAAADISVDGITPQQLAKIARDVGFPQAGLFVYPTHLHVDVRGLVGNAATDQDGREPVAIEVNGKRLDAPAYVEDGHTMVPARAVAEALGANVAWDGEAKTIQIASMTDLERLCVLLDEWGVGYERVKRKTGVSIRLPEGNRNIGGYAYVFTDFDFDEDGRFLEVGAYE